MICSGRARAHGARDQRSPLRHGPSLAAPPAGSPRLGALPASLLLARDGASAPGEPRSRAVFALCTPAPAPSDTVMLSSASQEPTNSAHLLLEGKLPGSAIARVHARTCRQASRACERKAARGESSHGTLPAARSPLHAPCGTLCSWGRCAGVKLSKTNSHGHQHSRGVLLGSGQTQTWHSWPQPPTRAGHFHPAVAGARRAGG